MSNKRKITYKCPYCDKRYTKEDLVHHVSNKHDDMIPEGYSAFRLVFDYVNKKPSGYNGKCIICGNESGWDEEKGKYNRICSNPACKKKYIQSFEERMMKSKGVTRISSTAEGQAKMLANRKISGEYKFQDGGIKTYTGTYEKKALEFMDKVMNIQSIDVTTPGPIMEYDFEGKKHIYISDIYYAPYNLIIEVKDGGNNPNMRSMPEYRAKQIAKEKYIIKNTDYNYLRLTNNDFSQLLAVFIQLKMEMTNDTPERVIRINEGNLNYIEESYIKSEPDILYNKEAFDNGDINICFVIGHSGSGKSTLAHSKESDKVEVYELDDLQLVADTYTMENLKEYGDLIYSFFNGPGKKYYITFDELKEKNIPGSEYEDKIYKEFVAYAINWAKKHKDKKYIIEGVWIFCTGDDGKPYFEPSYFKDYAFYIKGTSLLKSKLRAALRDSKYEGSLEPKNKGLKRLKSFTKQFLKNWKWYKLDEKRINKFRDYFKDKPETVLSESVLLETSISDYTFLDIKSNKSKALEYLKSSTQTKDYADDIIKNYVGEIVLYNNEMIGRIFVGDKKDKGFITDFEISEEHRGNKLGSKLIDDAIIKYHGIDLLVDKDNKIAIDMYKKRGFVVIKTVKNQYWMKLKSEIKEDTNMTEAMNALMTGYIPGSVDNPNNVYIVNYMQNNVFSGEDPNEDCIGVSDNPKFTNLIVRDKDGVLKKVDESFLEDKTYKVYILEMSRDEVSNRLSKYINTEVDKGFIYETLTGKKLYTNDQVQFESSFIPTLDYYEYMKTFSEICDNYFFARDKEEMPVRESNFIPREVKHFNKSGLMYTDRVINLDEFINSKPNKVLECLDIIIKEGV